ncbi:MAG: hypothetical protein ABEJ31_09020 [Haloarculaceae archaeon]
MSRPRGLVVLLGLLVVLAGCTGGPADAGDAGDGSGGGPGGAGTGAGDGTGDAMTAWDRFSFEPGEFYKYRVTDHLNDESAVLTWKVLSVQGGVVTAEVTYDDGTTTFDRTITGQNASVVFQLPDATAGRDVAEATSTAMMYLTMGPFSTMSAYFASRDLAVGNSWQLVGNEQKGYMTAAIEGRGEYAGKSCYNTAIRVPDNGEWTGSDANEYVACIAPDASLAYYTAYYDGERDSLAIEVELEEYRRA